MQRERQEQKEEQQQKAQQEEEEEAQVMGMSKKGLSRATGRIGASIDFDVGVSKFLIFAGMVIILGLAYFNVASPLKGQMTVATWNDANGDGVVQDNEIHESKLDLNPYSLVPAQALVKNSGEKFLYVTATVKYKVDKTISEPFYGIYGIVAYKDMHWEWVTPRFVELDGIEATKLSSGEKETLNNAYFAEGLKFTSASAGGPYTSVAVFPYNAKIGGTWKSKVLVLSNGVADKIYHSNHGTTDYSSHTLENWMKSKGLGEGTYQLFFYYAFAKASAVSDRRITNPDELIAMPVQSPVSFYVKLTNSPSTPVQIIGFNVNYKTQMMVMSQSFGDDIHIVLINPYIIAAALLIAVGVLMYMKPNRRRRRR